MRARSLVIASGARYRRLDVADLDKFEGSSVHRLGPRLAGKERLCAEHEVALVGGGNSAGQAIVYLASQARKVWVLVRAKSLEASMSRYLIERIGGLSNVELVFQSQVTGLQGAGGALETIAWRNLQTGEETRKTVPHLFLFIGADPNTDWLWPVRAWRWTPKFSRNRRGGRGRAPIP